MKTNWAETLLGKRLENKYELTEIIGIGGMSVVFKARDILLDRIVAIKVLLPELAADPSLRERFLREARTSANLNHPNIITIHTVGVENNIYYFVMDYIEGETLEDVIKKQAPLDFNKTKNIVKDVLLAIDYAHSRNVIHRDIKPGNIIISREGRCIVTDFGIAKVISSQKLTRTGTTIGTAEYMSPEQIEGKQIDYRSDYYSFGVMLYEMYTGKLPFDAEDPYTMGIKHLTEIPPEPKSINPEIPDYLNFTILKLMAKDPDKRFQSVDEIFKSLRISVTEKLTHIPKTRKITSPPPKKKIKKTFRLFMIPLIFLVILLLSYPSFLYFKRKVSQHYLVKTSNFLIVTLINSIKDYIFPEIKVIELDEILKPLANQKEIAYICIIDKYDNIVLFKGNRGLRDVFEKRIYTNLIFQKNPEKVLYKEIKYKRKRVFTFSKIMTVKALKREFKAGYISIGVYTDEI